MTLLDGMCWQLMVWWRLKKLVIAVGLLNSKAGFLPRDYSTPTASWDPKFATMKCWQWYSLTLACVPREKEWVAERSSHSYWNNATKSRREMHVQLQPSGTQLLFGYCYSGKRFDNTTVHILQELKCQAWSSVICFSSFIIGHLVNIW